MDNKPPKHGLFVRVLTYLIRQKPEPFFRFLRNTLPNVSIGKKRFFVTRYTDVKEVLDNPLRFQVIYSESMDPCVGPFMLGRDGTIFNERDKHIMRSMMSPLDLPYVANLVAQFTLEQLGPFEANKEIDIVEKITRDVPIRLTEEYFGFAGADRDAMKRWSLCTQLDMFHNATDKSDQVHQQSVQCGKEMREHLLDYIKSLRNRADDKKASQGNQETAGEKTPTTVLQRLLNTSFPSELDFNDERILSNTMGLLVGGIETTSQAVAQIMQQLLQRPSCMTAARKAAADTSNPDMLAAYCWEALRFNPINPFVLRKCVADTRIAPWTLRSRRVKAGQTVLVCTRSAMHDGRRFKSPRDFVINRPRGDYLHMGYGLHTCLGNQVSWVQITEIVRQLLLHATTIDEVEPMDYQDGPFPERYILRFR